MIGDVLTSSILFEALRLEYPKAQLDYLINEHTLPVVQNNPFIDNFILFTKKAESSKLAFLKLAKSVRQNKYDIVIDTYSKFSSNLISLYSGAKTKISKYKWYTSFIYTNTFKEEKETKTNAGLAIENRLQLLKPLGIKPNIIQPKVYLTNRETEVSKTYLEQNKIDLSKPIYMISVLGSSLNKTYPLEYMAKLIDAIVFQSKGQILFNYIPHQIDEAKAVYNFCKNDTKKQIYFNVFSKGLREFLAITSHCTALIGNEGGAVNMAKALSVPTFTVFSPWIQKNAWNMFENGKTNVSIHLKDVKPDLYTGRSYKVMKRNAFELYETFHPNLIIPKINAFLKKL